MKKTKKDYKKLYEKDEKYIKAFHEYLVITRQCVAYGYYLLLKIKEEKNENTKH